MGHCIDSLGSIPGPSADMFPVPVTAQRVFGGTVTQTVTWVVSEEDSGFAFFAVTSPTICAVGPGGDGGAGPPPPASSERSEETRVVVQLGGLATALGPEPLCQAGSSPVRGELDGVKLNDGTAWRTDTCGNCRASCLAMTGCDTWVWGDVTGGGGGGSDVNEAAAGECWLKKAAAADGTVQVRAPLVGASVSAAAAAGAVATSPYISGEVMANPPCDGEWGAHFGGDDLNDGAATPMASCATCATACRRRRGCNVWAYGVDATSGVYRQCWLRRVADAASPPRLPGGRAWLSGVIGAAHEGGGEGAGDVGAGAFGTGVWGAAPF